MINSEEKLALLSDTILSETKQKAEKLVSDAEKESARIIVEASDKYCAEAKKQIAQAQSDICSKYAKEVSSRSAQAKKEILTHRNMLARQLFDDVKDRLESFRLSDDYKEYINRCISEYQKNYDIENAEIRVSPKDMQRADELLGGLPKSVRITKDDTIIYGGIKIRPADGGFVCDHSFDTALEMQTESFASGEMGGELQLDRTDGSEER